MAKLRSLWYAREGFRPKKSTLLGLEEPSVALHFEANVLPLDSLEHYFGILGHSCS